jgi:predicted PurR-regulated permease PerM
VRLLMLMIPDEYEEGLRHVLLSVKFLLRRYFLGVLLQIFLICFFVTAGFTILGVSFNHAVTIGIVSGLFNVIPYVGPVLGALFGLLTSSIIYMQGPVELSFLTFMAFVGLIYVIVQLMDNLLFQPLIFSNSVQVHPLEIFIVILMSGYLSGVVGMFLAIPVYTIIRVIGREFF